MESVSLWEKQIELDQDPAIAMHFLITYNFADAFQDFVVGGVYLENPDLGEALERYLSEVERHHLDQTWVELDGYNR